MNDACFCDAIRTPIGPSAEAPADVRRDDLPEPGALGEREGRYAPGTMRIGAGRGIASVIERIAD